MGEAGQLQGRTALVTGAASGIGRSIAAGFAAEGARLAMTDLDLDRVRGAAESLPGETRTRSYSADLTDEERVRKLIESVVDDFGSIEILVNCAGMVSEAPFLEMSTQVWDEMIAINLRGVFLCCRYAIPHMVRRRWGRVINISSQLAIKGEAGLAHYCAAKSGVLGLTKALAREVAGDNVLVNAIAPGPIETPMISSLSPERRKAKQAELPLRRFGVPFEVAPTAILLASDPGGNLYVGQTLGPNSGDVMP